MQGVYLHHCQTLAILKVYGTYWVGASHHCHFPQASKKGGFKCSCARVSADLTPDTHSNEKGFLLNGCKCNAYCSTQHTWTSSSFLMGMLRQLYFCRSSFESGELIIFLLMWLGALKCLLRFFPLSEDSILLNFILASWPWNIKLSWKFGNGSWEQAARSYKHVK